MSAKVRPAVVELKIPSLPEFVSVARLAILGVASRTKFTYDQVEDLRLAVAEACTTAVERAARAKSPSKNITITSEVEDNKLTVRVRDDAGPLPQPVRSGEETGEIDEQNLGALLIELLVDEFEIESTPDGGTLVKMVKYAG